METPLVALRNITLRSDVKERTTCATYISLIFTDSRMAEQRSIQRIVLKRTWKIEAALKINIKFGSDDTSRLAKFPR